jgi:hypothetical protein
MKKCSNCLSQQSIDNNFCINCGEQLNGNSHRNIIKATTSYPESDYIKLTLPNSLFILSNLFLLIGFISIIYYSTNKDYEVIFNVVRYERFNIENISQESSYRSTYNTAIHLTKTIPFFSIVYIMIYYLNFNSWNFKKDKAPLLDILFHLFAIGLFVFLSFSIPDSNWVLSEVPLWIGLLYAGLLIKNVILK